ncbi:MAG: phage tail family protein [Acutalibacteraceae bacterium]
MQQLKYVKPGGSGENENDYLVLRFGEPYILESLSGVSGVEKTIVSSEVAGVDGVIVHNVRTEPRVVNATAYVYGKDRHEMYKNRQRLISILANTEEAGRLYYTNDNITVVIDAYPMLPGDFTDRIKNYNKCTIKFYCPFPHWSDTQMQASQLSYYIDENAFSFPLAFEDTVCFAETTTTTVIDYEGSVPSPVVFTLMGDLLSPIIRNETTGEQIEIADVSLADGDTLTVNTKKGAKSVILHKDGVTSDAFHLVTASSVFWQLKPGRNVISFSSKKGITSANLIISYTNLYGGV